MPPANQSGHNNGSQASNLQTARMHVNPTPLQPYSYAASLSATSSAPRFPTRRNNVPAPISTSGTMGLENLSLNKPDTLPRTVVPSWNLGSSSAHAPPRRNNIASSEQNERTWVSIHDPLSFDAKAEQIVNYIHARCPLLSGTGAKELIAFIGKCLREKQTRCKKSGVLVSIRVFGRFQCEITISDLYNAIAFLISETDPYPYVGTESVETLQCIHRQILAHYTKWNYTLFKALFHREGFMPMTTCIMYRAREADSDSNVPCYIAALGSSLGGPGHSKKEAELIQSASIQRVFPAINRHGLQSPEELKGHDVPLGICAELQAWLS
ncbi:hypothetical protein MIND_00771500 [Mycena indigotica]|uniref:Uncharacterized protein n=1 Tax=Mycena indigotica TaxID=2126181 RepID=A0A8H6SQD4_9AGAR|nr:uncharacterized protein MIND_00771500 [Mycena indigotica]KAF7302050.1 hypothetical protein MIND_00771500 [Mycena indigotica]